MTDYDKDINLVNYTGKPITVELTDSTGTNKKLVTKNIMPMDDTSNPTQIGYDGYDTITAYTDDMISPATSLDNFGLTGCGTTDDNTCPTWANKWVSVFYSGVAYNTNFGIIPSSQLPANYVNINTEKPTNWWMYLIILAAFIGIIVVIVLAVMGYKKYKKNKGYTSID